MQRMTIDNLNDSQLSFKSFLPVVSFILALIFLSNLGNIIDSISIYALSDIVSN